jgi:four helix bundle protein
VQHDNTHIYQRSIELIRLVKRVVDDLPSGYSFLADQLRRAASSVALNFSEGYGKSTPADQRRYFRIARGSAYEVAAALDVGLGFGAVSPTHHQHGKELCDHLAAMLTKFRNPIRR